MTKPQSTQPAQPAPLHSQILTFQANIDLEGLTSKFGLKTECRFARPAVMLQHTWCGGDSNLAMGAYKYLNELWQKKQTDVRQQGVTGKPFRRKFRS